MARSWLTCLGLVFLAGLAGCKGDEREEILVNLTKEIKDSGRQVGEIRVLLEEAIKDKDDKVKEKLETEKIKEAKAAIQKLKGKDGKENTESFVAKIVKQSSKAQKFALTKSDEDKDEFAKRNKKNLEDLAREIDLLAVEDQKLKEVLKLIGSKDEGVAKELEEDLRDLQGRLESIGQRK